MLTTRNRTTICILNRCKYKQKHYYHTQVAVTESFSLLKWFCCTVITIRVFYTLCFGGDERKKRSVHSAVLTRSNKQVAIVRSAVIFIASTSTVQFTQTPHGLYGTLYREKSRLAVMWCEKSWKRSTWKRAANT